MDTYNTALTRSTWTLAVGLMGAITAFSLSFLRGDSARAAETGGKMSNADAVCGTWVLQQANDVKELQTLLPKTIEPALQTPNLRGFSLRVPWKAIDEDFSLLEQGLKIARAHQLDYSVRFMAGRHTPARIFGLGCRFYALSPGKNEKLGGSLKVPAPFLADGSPNAIFEQEYDKFVARLAAWCRANGVRLLHLAWYGQNWAELNHGKEVRALPGYSSETWLKAHVRLLDIGLKYAGDDLAVEFPFSGYGPLTDSAVAFADHIVSKIGPGNPIFFCQANGWGPKGDWGAPSTETEAAFDRVWTKPICRGQQMIQPRDYDWPACYRRLYENKATYCEVYTPSFLALERNKESTRAKGKINERNLSSQGPEALAEEVRKFAEYCRRHTPLPDGKETGGVPR